MHPNVQDDWDQEEPFSSQQQGGGKNNPSYRPPIPVTYYAGYGGFFAIYINANTRPKYTLLLNQMTYREIKKLFSFSNSFLFLRITKMIKVPDLKLTKLTSYAHKINIICTLPSLK